MWQKIWAEFFGTFFLVFAGTGAIVIHQTTEAITHVGIALTFGLVVLAIIYTIGEISGAHINPAVTIAFAAAGRFPFSHIFPYVGAQLIGALLASGVLRGMFPDNEFLGGTNPVGPGMRSLTLEIILTWFLMFVVLNVSHGAKEKGITAGIVVGSVIALEAMFAGPICGASMNPVRSLAPAIVSGHLENIWIYLIGPTVGALLAIPTFKLVQIPVSEEQK